MKEFEAADLDHDGFLSLQELRATLTKHKIPCSGSDIDLFFATIDLNHDGKISLKEFENFALIREAELRRIFDLFDRDANGKLSSQEVKLGIRALGMHVSPGQLKQVMSQLGRQDSVTFDRWRDALLLLPAINPEAVFESYETAVTDDAAGGEFSRPRDARTMVGQTTWQGIAHQLYAGGIAGAISRTCTAPLERFKVLVQARQPGHTSRPMFTELRHIYGREGLRAFWRGNGANCLKVSPEIAFKFMLFEHGKEALAADPGNVTLLEKFVCGGLAGCGAQMIVYPLEILKTRISLAGPGIYSGFLDCFRHIVRADGPSGLYKGLGPSVLGIIPYAGVDLMMNSAIREKATVHYGARGQEPGLTVLLSTGMISSCCAMLVTYPLNLIRTRLQASGMPGAPHYTSASDCFRKAVAGQGLRGLYSGFAANLGKVLPATSISYAVYDLLKKQK